MDMLTALKLNRLNNDFYRENHQSFSATRQDAWRGWHRVLQSLEGDPDSILDVACGNLRFCAFIAERGIGRHARYHAVDSCSDLLPSGADVSFQCVDIVSELAKGTLETALSAPSCALTVCFGFMHHVATEALRMRLLDALVAKTDEGGLLAVSFWRFASDAKMLAKALKTTERACRELDVELDGGDFLLGWADTKDSFRYCHSFSGEELDTLIAHCEDFAVVVDRFKADGRTGEMNEYLVFRKR